MAMATKFYEYVPPATSPPNPVAEFMSGYLQMRTPYTMAKLKGLDPAARDAYLSALAKKEADLMGQFATAQREAARLSTEAGISQDESVREAMRLAAAQMGAQAQTEVANVNARTTLIAKRSVGAAGQQVLGALQTVLDGSQLAGLDPSDPAFSTNRAAFERDLANVAQKASRLTDPMERDAVAAEANRLVQGYTGTNPGPAKNLMAAGVQAAFSQAAPLAIREGGVQSFDRAAGQAIGLARQLRGEFGGPTVTGGSISSSTSTGSSGKVPAPSPAPREATQGPSIPTPPGTDSAAPAATPSYDVGTSELLRELERTRAERERVLSDDPAARMSAYDSVASRLFQRRGGPQVRTPPVEQVKEPREPRGPGIADRSVAALINLVGKKAAPSEEEAAKKEKAKRKKKLADDLVFHGAPSNSTGSQIVG